MTALTLQQLSGGRLQLGLGVSGPQVVEGWHGVPFRRPLAATRDYVAILRQALAADEKVIHEGTELLGPLRRAGRHRAWAVRCAPTQPRAPDTPIYVAALGPKNTKLAVEVADGILPYLWSPRHWKAAWGDALAAAPDGLPGRPDRRRRARRRPRRLPGRGPPPHRPARRRHGLARPATSTSRWSSATATRRTRPASRTCSCPATARAPSPPCPTSWSTTSPSSGPPAHVAEQLAAWRDGPITTLIVEPTRVDAIEQVAEIWASL